MINRNAYLYKLINSRNNGFPKVITEVRRSGKFYLLKEIYRQYLLEFLLSLKREEANSILPIFLVDSITDYRKAIRKDSLLLDCYSDQLRSSINAAEVENLISKEMADRLRDRYFNANDWLFVQHNRQKYVILSSIIDNNITSRSTK